MQTRPSPPWWARRLLRWVVGEQEAAVAEGELLEGFRALVEREGVTAARRWYSKQVGGFVLRAPAVRWVVRQREKGERMSVFRDLGGDVRWAVRSLRSRPTFTLVAVLTLALGIGTNSAIFTLVKAHFFTELPYGEPDRLVLLWETRQNSQETTTVAIGNYYAWKEGTRSFQDVAAFNVDNATFSGDGLAETVTATVVTPNFFDVLDIPAEVGGVFTEENVRAANGDLVVLGHDLWQRRFGADPGIVGRDVRIDGRPHTVVGVMPAAFRQPERALTWQGAEAWRPILLDEYRDNFDSRFLRTVARLAPGASVAQAREEMEIVSRRMEELHPASNAGRGIVVRTLDEYLLGDARPTLLMLLGAGVAVFLLVCANVANLTLARGQERRQEFAVRAALGSGGLRLMRQVVVESSVLALLGAAIGSLLVYAGSGVLQSVQASFFSGLIDVAVDRRVIGFTVIAAFLASLLFSVPLGRTASRTELRDALIEGGQRAGAGRGTLATRNALVVGQVALATMLVVAAMLLSRSFLELVSVPPGFVADGLLTFDLSAPPSTYPDEESLRRYYEEVWREVEAVPGVQSVAMVSDLPFTTENRWSTYRIDGLPYDDKNPPKSDFHTTFPEYFGVMGIPVLRGVLPEDGWEVEGDVPVIVNERMAEMFWPDREAVGSTLRFASNENETMRVVAVVGNVLDDGFAAAPEPILYRPYGASPRRRMAVLARLTGDPADIIPQVRQAVNPIDPDVPTADVRMMNDLLAETVVRPRAASLIGLTFAFLALLVAAAGIYGVLTLSVQQRTRELGIRTALGASGGQLVGMVLGHSWVLLGLGLGVGLAGALLAGRVLSGLLFGVRTWDPVSLGWSVALLGFVGTVAAWLPARRTTLVSPTEALRGE